MTLVGFLRGTSMNVYSGAHRLVRGNAGRSGARESRAGTGESGSGAEHLAGLIPGGQAGRRGPPGVRRRTRCPRRPSGGGSAR